MPAAVIELPDDGSFPAKLRLCLALLAAALLNAPAQGARGIQKTFTSFLRSYYRAIQTSNKHLATTTRACTLMKSLLRFQFALRPIQPPKLRGGSLKLRGCEAHSQLSFFHRWIPHHLPRLASISPANQNTRQKKLFHGWTLPAFSGLFLKKCLGEKTSCYLF